MLLGHNTVNGEEKRNNILGFFPGKKPQDRNHIILIGGTESGFIFLLNKLESEAGAKEERVGRLALLSYCFFSKALCRQVERMEVLASPDPHGRLETLITLCLHVRVAGKTSQTNVLE